MDAQQLAMSGKFSFAIMEKDLVLNETIFLLRKSQSVICYGWQEGVGDCKKLECPFCRIEKCIGALEGNGR